MTSAKLILSDGTTFTGKLFGHKGISHGEVVFNTALTGYEQSLSDPSYRGQILTFTFPLIGNYGIASEETDEYGLAKNFESESAHVRGVIVENLTSEHSHHDAETSLAEYLQKHKIPGISGIDTRALTQKLREHGVLRGQIVPEGQEPLPNIPDPNAGNLVAEVSCSQMQILEPAKPIGKTILALDTGIKNNILKSFLRRGVRILRCPWNTNITTITEKYDGIFLSNGPGNPEMLQDKITPFVDFARKKTIPLFGICLGNQLLALSLGAKTFKMKYGHRSTNQPCQDTQTQKAVVTSQNHGFAIDPDSLPEDVNVWFTNLNDGTVEGIRHASLPFSSVQFHPEACPGPQDTQYLFDDFIRNI